MKRGLSVLLLAAAGMLMAGCAAPTIRSEVTAFHEWPMPLQEKAYVFDPGKEQENNLEYRSYANLIREELKRLGFVEAPGEKSAQLKVALSYGIDARDVRVSEPVVISPYGYGPPWRGYYAPYYSPFYDPFWYGPPIVERRVSSYQVFTRQLRVVLSRVTDGKKLHEVRVISEGSNGSLPTVMPYLVRAAFADFPGKSGVPRRVELEMDK
jgi:hypothetical protein